MSEKLDIVGAFGCCVLLNAPEKNSAALIERFSTFSSIGI